MESSGASGTVPQGAIDREIATCLSGELSALEQLRALLQGNDEVSIPGVVVAGAQSAGKSSVLEALGGMKLPRGQNITTRVPLVLSLVATPGAEPHAIIGGDADLAANGKQIEVSQISTAIEELTNELAGNGSAVSAKPIFLKIVRPSGPTLTLIDLPGITHNSADGSQDIHTETVNLVKQFIENDNMVILVVIPAMDDFANAEAVALAKKYDPQGTRTLGVVTKTDDVRAGCGIKAKLRMDPGHVQLSLGFIAVVNRTPIEVLQDTPAEEIRARERKFFTTDPEVAGLEKEYWGMDTLVARIVDIQAERVRQFIPKFLAQAKDRTKELKQALATMPKVLANYKEQWEAYRQIVSAIRDELNDRVKSVSDQAIIGEDASFMSITPRVTTMYREFAAGIVENVIPDFFADEYYQKARLALRRVDGMTLSNLRAGPVFNALFSEIFSQEFRDRSEDLVEEVKGVMKEVLLVLCKHFCAAHPVLLNELSTSLVEEYMDIKEEATMATVETFIKTELGWVFTQDPSYEETMRKIDDMVNSVRESKAIHYATSGANQTAVKPAKAVGDVPKEFIKKMIDCKPMSEEDTIRHVQVTIHAYSKTICRHIFDSIPKQIHGFLVKGICDDFVPWMLNKVGESDVRRWLVEDAVSHRKRRELETKLSQFQAAIAILKSARG